MSRDFGKRVYFTVLTFLLAAVLSAQVFLLTAANHDHNCKHCAVCLKIDAAMHIWDGFEELLLRSGVFSLFLFIFKRYTKIAKAFCFIRLTPVSLKIKSNS
ncbi:MAG: hypothetical protein LBC53_09095 [Spirochaetaceae bacterium]|jgi:hypothetical protein|nr:hypothetical protein [Spirochaetaceae bacterium]